MHETNCAGVWEHTIIEKYFNMVYHLALSQTKDKNHADDVCQEVFLRFVKTDKTFKDEEHAKAWLIRVTINCSKNVFNNLWYKRTEPLSEDIVFETEEKSDIYYAVNELPPKYRTVIHLFYYEDLSIEQIAKYLKAKESTIKSQLHRGRELLKSKLKEGFEDV